MDLNARRHGGRKHLRDGAVEFLDDVEFFDMAFTQLRVAHDLGDDLIGAGDFLLDDSDLLRGFGPGVPQGALQRECGAVDDRQRIFDLMRKLGGEPSGGMQLSFPRGEFLRFLDGQPLAFQQRLRAVAANGRQQQHHQPQQKRLAPILARGQVQRALREFIQIWETEMSSTTTST